MEKVALYPMVFTPNIRPLRWGVERWLVSAHRYSPSVIANGPLFGKRLDEVFPDFPILVKLLDVKERLSLQVHPDDQNASLTGGEPKTELWRIIQAEAGASLIAGLKSDVGEDELKKSIATEDFNPVLESFEVSDGETYFIPGGLVHSLGDGLKVLEVQQPSDSTYRLYDWGLVGLDGKPREVHVDKALKSIRYGLRPFKTTGGFSSQYFSLRDVNFEGECAFKPIDRMRVVFLARGTVILSSEALACPIALVHDTAALIPPGIDFRLESMRGEASLVEITA